MDNFYQLLGVSREASPSVVKIAYEGKLKALERVAVPEDEKAAERKALERAFVTLSNPAKKAWYDERLEDHEPASSARGASRSLMLAAFVALLAVGGATWFLADRAHERERLRLQEERLALEREKAQKAAELEQARLQQGQQVIDIARDNLDSARAARERAYGDGVKRVEAYDAQRRESEARAASSRPGRERPPARARRGRAPEALRAATRVRGRACAAGPLCARPVREAPARAAGGAGEAPGAVSSGGRR